jgi:hypothetical protein
MDTKRIPCEIASEALTVVALHTTRLRLLLLTRLLRRRDDVVVMRGTTRTVAVAVAVFGMITGMGCICVVNTWIYSCNI